MAEVKKRKNKKSARSPVKNDSYGMYENFYGALKSKDEVYFQLASLFDEVTKDKSNLASKWLELLVRSKSSDSSGIFFSTHI